MQILITAGVFGHQTPTGRVVPIHAGEVVEVADSVGTRLIQRGVAQLVIVETQPEGMSEEEAADLAAVVTTQDEQAEDTIPQYNTDMNRAQLEKIGVDFYGIDEDELHKAKNKAAVIALLDEAREEYEATVPNFDAADAIQ